MDSDRKCFFNIYKCLNKNKQTFRTLSQNSRSKNQNSIEFLIHHTACTSTIFQVITHMKEKNLEDESENDIECFAQ